MWKKIGIGLAVVLIVILGFLGYAGLFTKIEVTINNFGPFYMMYKEKTGDYKDLGDLFDEFDDLRKEMSDDVGDPAAYVFGIYHDNPNVVEESKLRGEVGLLLAEKKYLQMKDQTESKDYQFKTIPKKEYFSTNFPMVTELSMFIGIFRAYPALEDYITEYGEKTGADYSSIDSSDDKGGFAIEIYRPKTIQYMITKVDQ